MKHGPNMNETIKLITFIKIIIITITIIQIIRKKNEQKPGTG